MSMTEARSVLHLCSFTYFCNPKMYVDFPDRLGPVAFRAGSLYWQSIFQEKMKSYNMENLTPNVTSNKKYTGFRNVLVLSACSGCLNSTTPKITSHDPNNHQNATQNFPNNTEIFHTKTPTIISIPTCKYYHHSNNQIKINCHVKYQ